MSAVLFSLKQAATWIPGAALVGDADLGVQRVHTDSRTLQVGDLFVALRGERFDGHDFLAQLSALGVRAAVAEDGLTEHRLSGLQVSDSRRALGEIARGWRCAHPIGLIAVTGSNGKTTVTQMLASILRTELGDAALSTLGNFNNDIGVPLTLLRLRPEHRLAVLELGMNHPGEIAQLAAWAQPTVALVNNAQREHQEFMHSVRAVAEENGAVLQALPAHGVGVFPADDEHTALWRTWAGARATLTFGPGGDVFVESVQRTELGWRGRMTCTPRKLTFEFSLNMPGEHNLRNAMAATACALAAGVSIQSVGHGLAEFRPVSGRSHASSVSVAGHRITLVDDSYNANPDSVRAAIDLLAQLPVPRLLVLGDMGEVGDQGPQFHIEVGHYARERGIEHLLGHGELAALSVQSHGQGQHHAHIDTLCAGVDRLIPQLGSMLVKGSRFMRMERVVQHIVPPHNKETATC
ncbi:MAG: UDP-N-acetylmuramoyl-tripeptide--D-alanyl-D-alanine ligase [Alphaproteobacteria bacterium]|nr:UDP-N-acetylmuramoyl-tripeptide--D-alanyl-D-alanine ligase [Alphaproteobacteria bacterium]MDI9329904.1 UDP-N-acetylmuramoyl-tripeptide--D-alanyl-D-alanine ligase [Alphaproteobacteria bacterium]